MVVVWRRLGFGGEVRGSRHVRRAEWLLPELEMLKCDSQVEVERSGNHHFHGGPRLTPILPRMAAGMLGGPISEMVRQLWAKPTKQMRLLFQLAHFEYNSQTLNACPSHFN